MARCHLPRVFWRSAGNLRPKSGNRLDMFRPMLDLRVKRRPRQLALPRIGIKIIAQAQQAGSSVHSLKQRDITVHN